MGHSQTLICTIAGPRTQYTIIVFSRASCCLTAISAPALSRLLNGYLRPCEQKLISGDKSLNCNSQAGSNCGNVRTVNAISWLDIASEAISRININYCTRLFMFGVLLPTRATMVKSHGHDRGIIASHALCSFMPGLHLSAADKRVELEVSARNFSLRGTAASGVSDSLCLRLSVCR